MSSNRVVEHTPGRVQLGWGGTLTAVWSLAGGIAGGLLIALVLVTGRLHPEGAVIFAVGLGAAGSILGTLHGAVLGRLSRPTGDVRRGDPIVTALAIGAAFVISIAFALWLGISAFVARSGRAIGLLALTAIGAVSLTILAYASLLGWRALERAYHRWPDHQLGLRLMLGAFAVLLVLLLGIRPAIPGTGLQFSTTASVVIAAMAALWIATPAIIVGLRYTHRRDGRN